MIKDNQKLLNLMHVIVDAIIIAVSYILSWSLRFEDTWSPLAKWRIIPAPIAKYVADNYPDNKIVQIERDTRSTEVKLDNRMEIKFDKQHRVIEMDFYA